LVTGGVGREDCFRPVRGLRVLRFGKRFTTGAQGDTEEFARVFPREFVLEFEVGPECIVLTLAKLEISVKVECHNERA
jgi:hypothetical protein